MFKLKISAKYAYVEASRTLDRPGRRHHEESGGPKHYISLRVTGKYTITDGDITTHIPPNDVRCYVSPGREYPCFDVSKSEIAQLRQEVLERMYEESEVRSNAMANTIKTERKYLWIWQNEPVCISDTLLMIGSKATFTR